MKFDNVLNKTIKVLLVIIICIMLTIGAFFVFPPTYAVDNFDNQPLPVQQYIYYPTDNVALHFGTNGNGYNGYVTNKMGNVDMYAFLWKYNDTQTCLTVCHDNILDTNQVFMFLSMGSAYVDQPYCSNTDDTYNLKYNRDIIMNTEGVTWYIPYFNTQAEGFQAVRNVIDGVVTGGTFAAFPQVSSSTDIDYATIAAEGAFVYAGINTYSFLGQYESTSAPVSQYCYVQTGENAYTAVVFSSIPLTVYKAFINGQTYSYSVCEQYDEGKYCYSFNQFSTLDDVSPLVPFSSLTDAKNAFNGASSGSGSASGVISAGALTYQVPAGNVLYVRVRPGSIASVTANMPVISSTTSPYWLESQINTMWASGVAGLPSSNTVFPLSNMTRINFGLDPSVGTDGYGRSFSAYASHAPFNGGWFVVYNPAYTKAIIPGRTDLMTINPTVTVKCQFALEYYMYPLSETLTVDGGTSSNSTGYTDSWSGQYDPDNDNFEDTSTITDETPTSGGEQAPTINQNNMDIGGYVREIKKTLDEFVNTLSQLLTVPIAHIQKLITYASNFMASIAQFFTWLPEPVYTVIVGALVVAVVIGILKLLF